MNKEKLIAEADRVDCIYYLVMSKNVMLIPEKESEMVQKIADFDQITLAASRSGKGVQDAKILADELNMLLDEGRTNFSIVFVDVENNKVTRMEESKKDQFIQTITEMGSGNSGEILSKMQ